MWASVCLPALASNKIRGKQVHRDQPFISLGILGEGIIRAGSRPGWSELAARPRSWTQAAPSKQPWPQAPPPPSIPPACSASPGCPSQYRGQGCGSESGCLSNDHPAPYKGP